MTKKLNYFFPCTCPGGPDDQMYMLKILVIFFYVYKEVLYRVFIENFLNLNVKIVMVVLHIYKGVATCVKISKI